MDADPQNMCAGHLALKYWDDGNDRRDRGGCMYAAEAAGSKGDATSGKCLNRADMLDGLCVYMVMEEGAKANVRYS